jgi:hypothetical protein
VCAPCHHPHHHLPLPLLLLLLLLPLLLLPLLLLPRQALLELKGHLACQLHCVRTLPSCSSSSVPAAAAAAAPLLLLLLLLPRQALLELKGRLLVEAALEEVVSLVAAHLDLLQVGGGVLFVFYCLHAYLLAA